jgi:CheY-like chemotaxis protein
LVVDDQRPVADTMCELLCVMGYDCSAAYDGADALERVDEHKPALVITDVVMPQLNGIDLAWKIRAAHPDCAVLLLSGNAATQELLELAHAGGQTFQVLAKPIPPRELLDAVAKALAQRNDPAVGSFAGPQPGEADGPR